MQTLFIYYQNSQTPQSVIELMDAIFESLPANSKKINYALEGALEQISNFCKVSSAVILHNSVTYFSSTSEQILSAVRFSNSEVPIIAFKQDEHLEPWLFDSLFIDWGVSHVFTCVRNNMLSRVYPKSIKGNVQFVHMYTTYVDDGKEYKFDHCETQQPIKRLTYRGSLQPPELGRLGFDKVQLPERVFNLNLYQKGWIFDLSSKWEDRIYGDSWKDFINGSFAIMATESGSNTFDLDGSLRARSTEFQNEFGNFSWEDNELIEKFRELVLVDYEENVDYGTFAPRHLEAALSGKPQILTRGNYDGLFVDKNNCLFIEEDMSSLSELLSSLENLDFYNNVSFSAFHEIESNPDLRISSLTNQLNSILDVVAIYPDSAEFSLDDFANSRQDLQPTFTETSPQAVVLCPVPHHLDPRHEWWASSLLSSGLETEIWEFSAKELDREMNQLDVLSSKYEINHKLQSGNNIPLVTAHSRWSEFVFEDLIRSNFFDVSEEHDARYLVEELFKLGNSPGQSDQQFMARLFLNTLLSFKVISQNRKPSLVIANDLQTAFAANIIWKTDETKIIYDAQEVFTAMYDYVPNPWSNQEKELWEKIEIFSCNASYKTVVVSPGIQKYYKSKYGLLTDVLPNFVPVNSSLVINSLTEEKAPVRFVFMGNAAQSRGLVELVTNWKMPGNLAELHLFIPESEAKFELLKEIKKHFSEFPEIKIQLHSGVPEHLMIETLGNYDVGIVPYDYKYPYNHCSPNKLGQYVAAGLAIVANDQPFVTKIIAENNLGMVFSWRDIKSVNTVLESLSQPSVASTFKANTKAAFKKDTNWEFHCMPFLKSLNLIPHSGTVDTTLSFSNFIKKHGLISVTEGSIYKVKTVSSENSIKELEPEAPLAIKLYRISIQLPFLGGVFRKIGDFIILHSKNKF